MAQTEYDRLWTRPEPSPDDWRARWDGARVGEDVSLEVWAGPSTSVGARYFRCYLQSGLGRPLEPVAVGLVNAGPFPGYNWVEVVQYNDVLRMEDGRTVQVPDAIEQHIFQQFALAVPPGGHLMVEYDSPARSTTAHALAAKAPPLATPLGALLYAVGCGDAFRDWYYPEGGREGPRKLQGFRAPSEEHARKRGLEMLAELKAFMTSAADLDWDLQAQTRPIAEAAIQVLSTRFEGG